MSSLLTVFMFSEFSLIGLALIAVGTGGIKPCVSSFGGRRNISLNSINIEVPSDLHMQGQITLITRKENFPHILGNFKGSGAKSYMTNDHLIDNENIYAFPHILGSPFSYMTLHPIPSKFPYI